MSCCWRPWQRVDAYARLLVGALKMWNDAHTVKVYIGARNETPDVISDADRDTIVSELERFGIDGATVYDCTGVWGGQCERSLVVEVYIWGTHGEDINGFVAWVKDFMQQEAVMVTSALSEVRFI